MINLQEKLDTVGKRCLKWSFFITLILPFFFSLSTLIYSLFYFSLFFFFLFLFICASWATPHPEKRWQIGFLVSSWHTFLLIFGSLLGMSFGYFLFKLSQPYFKVLKTWLLPSFFKF